MQIKELVKPEAEKTLSEHVDNLLDEMPELDPGFQPKELLNKEYINQLTPTNTDIEGFDLWTGKKENSVIFAIKDENKNLLSLVLATPIQNFENTNKTALVIKFSYTPPNVRGQGYSPALYYGLYQMGYIIISDAQVSDEANSVWQKIRQRQAKEIKNYDWNTKSFTDDDPVGNRSISYVLMDHIEVFTRKYTLFEGKLILKQMKRFSPH